MGVRHAYAWLGVCSKSPGNDRYLNGVLRDYIGVYTMYILL